MAIGRSSHNAVLLADGRVLIVGGTGDMSPSAIAQSELFDPISGTFSLTGSLGTERWTPTTHRLDDGRVLVTGGTIGGGDVWKSVEIYDPTSGTFVAAANMNTPRDEHASVLLPSGQVLVVGGTNYGNFRLDT